MRIYRKEFESARDGNKRKNGIIEIHNAGCVY